MKRIILASVIAVASFSANAGSYGPNSSQFICAAVYKALGDKLFDTTGASSLWRKYHNKGNDLFEMTTAGDADWQTYKALKTGFKNADISLKTQAVVQCEILYPTH